MLLPDSIRDDESSGGRAGCLNRCRRGGWLIRRAAGNPLALLELPRGGTADAVPGGFGLPLQTPLASRIEQGFVRQLEPRAAGSCTANGYVARTAV